MQQTVGDKIIRRQKELKAQKRLSRTKSSAGVVFAVALVSVIALPVLVLMWLKHTDRLHRLCSPAKRHAHALVLVAFLATMILPMLTLLVSRDAAAAPPYTASDVLGQLDGKGQPLFNRGASPSSYGDNGNYANLATPSGIATDLVNHRLFVSDEFDDRVMIFTLDNSNKFNAFTASYELGQPGLDVYDSLGTGLAQNRLYRPDALAYDSARQYLFVADDNNSRVVVYDLSGGVMSGMNASYVLGEPDFVTENALTTQNGLSSANGLAFDTATNNLFASDFASNRVLVYDTTSISNGMNASHVLGQPNFTSSGQAAAQNGMFEPSGLDYDSASSTLYVADGGNNRVLTFDLSGGISDGMNASHVLGQPNFTSSGPAITQNGMRGPNDISYDPAGQRLFVAEFDNSRTTVFDLSGGISDGMNASHVLGQPNFTAQDFTRDQDGQDSPYALEYVPGANTLLVGDYNRMLQYDVSSVLDGMPANGIIGQNNGTRDPDYTSYDWDNYGYFTSTFMSSETSLLDKTNHRLFVADTANGRILIYDLDSSNNLTSYSANHVIGHPSFSDFSADGLPKQNNLMWNFSGGKTAMAYDNVNNRLFVSDYDNNRVMVYDLSGGITNGMNASYVLGQPNFTSNGTFTTQSSLWSPQGLAYDSANSTLYVTDRGNYRVMVYDLSGGITNGMNASYVLGQPNFTTNSYKLNLQKGVGETGLAYDNVNHRLFTSGGGSSGYVIIYDLSGGISNGMDASWILGDINFDSTDGSVNSLSDKQRMSEPSGLWYDTTAQALFVADSLYNRVTVFNLTGGITNGMSARDLIGQANYSASGSGTSQTQLKNPTGVTYDSASQKLYVSDKGNNRVMIYDNYTVPPNPGTPYLASNVVGQMDGGGNGVFDQNTAYNGNGTPNNEGFDYEGGTVIDPINHRLFVSDCGYGVRIFNLDSTNTLIDRTADYILGQPDFTSSNTTVDQSTMRCTEGASIDESNQRLFVADVYNSRVLVFDLSGGITNGMNASYVLGQPDFTSNDSATASQNITSFLWGGTAYDPASHYLYVGDSGNARVLVYDLSGGISNGMNASYVLGQPDFTSNTTPNTTQAGLSYPNGLSIDSANHRLFVADWWDAGRVMVFDTSTLSNGMNASNVLGEADFTSSDSASDLSNIPDAKSFGPGGLAYDANHQRLFVEDSNSNRILIFDVNSISDNEDAVALLGQHDFVNDESDCIPTQAYMCGPYGISDYYDNANNRLYVSDGANNRVLIYNFADLEDNLAAGAAGTPYSTSVGAYAQGTPAYSVTAGSLPGGMSLDSGTGELSGTPASSGSYNFTIQLSDDNGALGTFTDTVAYSFTVNGPGDTTAPTVPTNVHEISSTTTTITVGWNSSTDDTAVTGYHIYRDGGLIGSSATTSFLDSGLTPGTTYSYTVSAYDGASNESAQSSPAVDISTDSSPPSPPPAPPPSPGPSPSPSPNPSPSPSPSSGGNGSSGGSATPPASGSQGTTTDLDNQPGFTDGSGYSTTGEGGDSFSFTPAVLSDQTETITITQVDSDTVTFQDNNNNSFGVDTGVEVSQDVNGDNQPDIRLAVAQIDEGTASLTFWKVLPVKPDKPGSGTITGSANGLGAYSGFSSWLDKLLNAIFGHLPPIVVAAFPWLIFVLLALTVARLLNQARKERQAAKRLEEQLAKERSLSEQKANFITLGSHYLRTPLTAISGGVELMNGILGAEATGNLKNLSDKLGKHINGLLANISGQRQGINYAGVSSLAAPAAIQPSTVISPSGGGEALLTSAGASDLKRPVAVNPAIFRQPVFYVPAIATLALVLLGDYLYSHIMHFDISLVRALTQAVAMLLLAVLLYTAVRSRSSSRQLRQNQLQLLDKQRSLDEQRNQFIVAGVAELETPLAQIKSQINNLVYPTEKLAKPITSAIAQFESTIAKFRMVAGLAGAGIAARRQTVDLYALVNDATNKLKGELDAKKLRVELNLTQEWIDSDDQELGLVVESLLSNAIKYSPEGGVIKIGSYKKDDSIQITVSDSGPGIDEAKRKQLFEPFSRAEDAARDFNRQGIGLSLYADRLIMQYLGGSIDIAPAEGQGAKAVVTV
ncbi:MAG TPA: ATP-binding protein [Candidatus Saccharimonadales bacterium]|nr:ATP-binding protein [Candidatus Saccharimonadales bacterium]